MRVYGPVPSRRFGLSLGIDLVPHKTCTFDCVYCQCGRTTDHRAEPAAFYPVEEVLADVAHALATGPRPEVITLAGSGEPTLYGPLGQLVRALREAHAIPLLLITNSSLLWRPDVAEAALLTDVLAPSLDAGDARTFARLDRPCGEVSFEMVLEGLREVTHAHRGAVRVEVMLVRGVNDDEASLQAIAAQLATLRFDKVDVNTPVRPPVPGRGALPSTEDALARALELFGPRAEAIGRFAPSSAASPRSWDDTDKDVREVLLRRPCTADDISASLGLHPHAVARILARLEGAGLVERSVVADAVYWVVPAPGSRRPEVPLPENHVIEMAQDIARIRFHRTPCYDDFVRAIDELSAREIYDRRLWDFSTVPFEMTVDEIRRIAEYGKAKFPRANRLAILAPEDLAFGLSRAFEVYRADSGVASVRVFRHDQEAIDWLAQ